MDLSLIQSNALIAKARELQVEPAALFAVVKIESNGVIGEMINGRLEPIIRYEGHYFDKLCKAVVREAARAAGVSAKSAGEIKNPKSQKARWNLVLKAASFDAAAAYQSVSYGIGQVMGAHWKILGFTSVDHLVEYARSGFEGQLDIMCRYIQKFGLLDELQALDFSGFARGYNGPAYRKYAYHTKMEKAYYGYNGKGQIAPVRSGALRIGSKGAGVRDVQALLRMAGYNIAVDGDFGTSTKKAVKAFQLANKLSVDGVIGPETQRALSKFRDTTVDKPGQQKLLDVEGVQKGAALAVGIPATIQSTKSTIEGVVTQLAPYEFLSGITNSLNIALGVLTISSIVFGVGYGLYKWRQSKKTYTGVKTKGYSLDSVDESHELILPPSGG